MRGLWRLFSQSAWWLGLMVGAGGMWVFVEFPYVNWATIALPIDERPVKVRQDAKGDGKYLAPRSGHRRHQGIDLAAPLGSPVRAIWSGTVLQVGSHRGYGNFVELEHQDDLRSLYAHLSETLVKSATRVKQGEIIGTVGKTGNARHRRIDPHVHLEITRDGDRIDPTDALFDAVASTDQRSPDGRGGG